MYGAGSVISFGPEQRWSANGGSTVNLNLSTDQEAHTPELERGQANKTCKMILTTSISSDTNVPTKKKIAPR